MTEDTTTRKPLRNTRENAKYKAYTTMNKLIEVAEELYKQIDKAQVHLLDARLNNDEEGKKSAISEMETAMCNTMQLLKCFIERKDNIVDLSEVWHKVNNEPNDESRILIINDKDDWYSLNHKGYKDNDKHWESVVRAFAMTKWAYLDGLLPKGGEG